MNEPIHVLHEIDRYLNGEMEGQELDAFEQLRLQDASFSARVEDQLEFRRILKAYGDRQLLREKIARIEAMMPSARPVVAELPAPVPMRTRGARTIWASVAAAATVALLIAGASIWFSGILHQDDNNIRYRELRRDLESIKQSQKAIINDMKTPGVPQNPGKFGGTGFAVSSNGYLATNFHVIQNADSVYVQDSRGNAYKVTIVYQDPVSDLAILKITDTSFQLPPLPYALLNKAADLGEDVFTLGYPKDDIVYGKGYISAESGFRDDTAAYQISLNVNPGNSGGPLLDNRGNVVGIVSGKETPSTDIAFAVKSAYLNTLLDSLKTDSVHFSPSEKGGSLAKLSRTDQIKKLSDYIFVVKVWQ